MKRLGGIAAISALLLAGCASTTALPEADYFDLVRETPGLSGLTDENIRNTGEQFCGVFDTSEDAFVQLLNVAIDNGMDAGDAGAYITYSVTQYCPEHTDLLPIN